MSNLILPPNYAQIRPLAATRTEDLIYELQQRQVIAELKGEIAMPTFDQKEESLLQSLREEQIKQMAQQMGVAIAQTPFCLLGSRPEPNPLDPARTEEVLVMSVCLVKHPQLEALTASNEPTP